MLTDPQNLNPYAYVRNNPIVNTDPTGNITNPLAYLYDSSVDKIYNGLATGNWGMVAEGVADAAVTTILVADTAVTLGMGGGALYSGIQQRSASVGYGPVLQKQNLVTAPQSKLSLPAGRSAAPALPSGSLHKSGTCFCTLSNQHANRITTPGSHGYGHRNHFSEMNESQHQLHIRNTIAHPTHMKYLKDNRIAFYDQKSNTFVIINRNAPDRSSAYRPADGINYFHNIDKNKK